MFCEGNRYTEDYLMHYFAVQWLVHRARRLLWKCLRVGCLCCRLVVSGCCYVYMLSCLRLIVPQIGFLMGCHPVLVLRCSMGLRRDPSLACWSVSTLRDRARPAPCTMTVSLAPTGSIRFSCVDLQVFSLNDTFVGPRGRPRAATVLIDAEAFCLGLAIYNGRRASGPVRSTFPPITSLNFSKHMLIAEHW